MREFIRQKLIGIAEGKPVLTEEELREIIYCHDRYCLLVTRRFKLPKRTFYRTLNDYVKNYSNFYH